MPLVRFQVRNEYGLGKPELYSEASREDPKAVLDGVAVSGLVGILRQLGDLAEFAAEVFHGLQEQVMTTASRSQTLMSRVQRIEAALPPLEKRVLAQTSHIHFAYTTAVCSRGRKKSRSCDYCKGTSDEQKTIRRICLNIVILHLVLSPARKLAGSDWHARIHNQQHHFIDNDLPRFIMDSYEECRDPPRLHLLDKFDTGGPGSCLRRYSDPTFFRRVSVRIDEPNPVKIRRDKRSRKIKKKRSLPKNGEFSRGTSISNRSSRLQFSSSIVNGRASPDISVEDLTFDSGMGDRVNSFDSRSGSGYIECLFSQTNSMQLDERGSNRSSTSRPMHHDDSVDSVYRDEESFSGIMRKKGFKTSSSQLMQHENSFVSVSHEDESGSISSSTRKKVFKTSSSQLMQPEDSVVSISREEESSSTSSSVRKKGSKTPSAQLVQPEDSVGSVSHEDESASISSSMREKGSKDSSNLQMQHNDSVGLVTHEEESATISSSMRSKDSKVSSTQLKLNEESVGGGMSSVIRISSHSPPRIASDLSSVTWEEKTEIRELSEPNICTNEAPESVFPHSNVDEQEEAVTDTTIDELDIQFNSQSISKLVSNEDQADDFDSEVDNYVDALNTIESESESDLDYQMKREVGQFLPENRELMTAVEEELTTHSIDHQPPNFGYNDASDGLSEKGMATNLPEAASSESSDEEVAPQVGGISADSDCSPDSSVPYNNVLDAPKAESVTHDRTSPGFSPPQDEIKSNTSAEHQESPVKLAGVDFWTNGGLLGLQPAKPPVFDPSDNASIDVNPSVPTLAQKEDDSQSNLLGLTNGHGSSSITLVAPGSAVPVAPTAKVAPSETSKENEEISAGVFGFNHRLFVNSFRRKLSLVYDEKPDIPSSEISPPAVGNHESSQEKAAERVSMGQFETISPVNSSPPSPPLEHMKISFHPASDFETSKLGLRFADENNSREKVKDMFSSFQLVPQPAFQMHGAGSYSDDDDDNDTFCRSSPSISDGYPSDHSESNSEQWESDSHERIQSDNGVGVGPVHSFPETVGESELNLPSFDSVRSMPKQEKNDKPGPKSNDVPMQSMGQSTPPPPPLPPPEWRATKHEASVAEHENEPSVALNDAIQLASHVQQPPKLAPARPQNFIEEMVQVMTERKDRRKSNAIIKDSLPQGGNGMTSDDKDDFLQQIRTKSFNLRRTVTPKPAAPTQAGNNPNVKVTAILQKANAIRQVVGSDDGEDDSWSDT